jgi:Flp pilus assembly protein TadG
VRRPEADRGANRRAGADAPAPDRARPEGGSRRPDTRIRRPSQKGAAAVELALTIPTALLIVAGTLYLGRALHARGRLVDAVGFAARSEAIAAGTRPGGLVDANAVTAMVNGRLADETACLQPVTVQVEASGVAPYRHLDVKASCQLAAPLLGAFLPNFSMSSVEATAAMPLDYETP